MFSFLRRREHPITPFLERMPAFTPDIARLQQYKVQLLFVYDECMKQHQRHSLIQPAEFQCTAFTEGQFSLWKKKLGKESFPIPLNTSSSMAPHSIIKGELWAIPPDNLVQLDNHKLNTVQFIRKRVRLIVPYTQQVWARDRDTSARIYNLATPPNSSILQVPRTALIKAWMYVGIDSFWDDQLDAGYLFSPVRNYTPNNFKLTNYYYFSPEEYRDK
jgi:hypothetical protein